MARFIHPLLADTKSDGKLKCGVLTNGTFEAGLELPLLDGEFDEDEAFYAMPIYAGEQHHAYE